jgi:hypothetical protein
VSADERERGAELAQVQRMARSMPPLCNLCTAAAQVTSFKRQVGDVKKGLMKQQKMFV